MGICFRKLTLFGAVVFAGINAVAFAQISDHGLLTRKLEEQQQAISLTRSLLAQVLDGQLRQLEENSLTEQQVYHDIFLTRQNLDRLAATEMTHVVQILVEAQQSPQPRQEELLIEARQQIRAVARQLATERRGLLKRLKIAELFAYVELLIRRQTEARKLTTAIPLEPPKRREANDLQSD